MKFSPLCCVLFRYVQCVGSHRQIYVPFIAKLRSRKCTTAAALARFILVPAFYFTAKYGEQGYMIFLTSLLGLSNGYLTVCVLTVTVTEAPKGYKYNVTFTLLYTSRHQLLKDRFFFLIAIFCAGAREKRAGECSCCFRHDRAVFWCRARLVMVDRERLVILKSPHKWCY